MAPFQQVDKISPAEFERLVRDFLSRESGVLEEFTATHQESINTAEGAYRIDVAARFSALGLRFLVLVECKKEKRKTEREVVQVLFDKIRATGAQKGVIFSTAGFQSGAIDFAKQHGIALIGVGSGSAVYETRSAAPAQRPEILGLPNFALWHYDSSPSGGTVMSLLNADEIRSAIAAHANRFNVQAPKLP